MKACHLTMLGIHACNQEAQFLDLFLKLESVSGLGHIHSTAHRLSLFSIPRIRTSLHILKNV